MRFGRAKRANRKRGDCYGQYNGFRRLKNIGIALEYASDGKFPQFAAAHAGETILLLADRNTKKYAEALALPQARLCLIDEDGPVPDERVCARAVEGARECDFVLAVGSGTLNDTAKYAALCTGKKSGVLATAPSIDGYASPVAAILKNGFKVSENAHVPSDILVDPAILAAAPGEMIAAGVWATSGVGMAAGAGLYLVAFGATVILIGVQCLFHIRCRVFQTKKFFQVNICFVSADAESDIIKSLFQTDRFNRLVIERTGGETVYHATLNTDKEFSSQRLREIMAEHPFIRSIERVDES